MSEARIAATEPADEARELDIAVIGMAGRFPGARNLEEFWANLSRGVEAVTFLTDAELAAAGVDAATRNDRDYVPAVNRLEDADCFDAAFFGYSPKEAAMMNPQGRVFLECVWHAMENAGYSPAEFPGAIGLYASESLSTYLMHNVHGHMDLEDFVLGPANIQAVIGNSQDFVATRVSYKLNLRGPSLTVQTACSSSLTAVHLARQALLNGECEMAIAGGVSIYLPQDRGYRYQDGLILSPDGHCRPFAADARGIVFGRGAGAVVLKPLLCALEDGDHVRAVIRGSAANNDGAQKVGYTAPSIAGQARVIREALADADVDAESITYIEAHGTGTPQGDPIEIAALTEAYQRPGARAGRCAIGSVKGNIGHLDVAAGVTSFIKTVLMLEQRQLAPSINCARTNPDIDFASSPFRVNTALRPWESATGPRRAGVSAFGFGGTNVHLILEEAPAPLPASPPTGASGHVLRLSARSEPALQSLTERFATYLAGTSEAVEDICHSANTGRASFDHRLVVRASSAEGLREGLAALASGEPHIAGVLGHTDVATPPPIAFLFTGLGAQYVGMGRNLFDTQPVFRAALEECDALLRQHLERPLLQVLYPAPGESSPIDETAYGQPTMFAFEYALAKLWGSWGIRPAAVLGHSLGEYAAACLAGLLSLPDAIRLVAERARLMHSLPAGGAMAAVFASEDQVADALAAEAGLVSIASYNSPENLVLSGHAAALQRVADQLTGQGLEVRMLNVSRAFHSALLDPVLDQFEHAVAQASFGRAGIPIISNVTGRLLSESDGRDPRYWRRHAREPVRFADGIRTLYERGIRQFVEIGPHTTASGMAAGSLPDDVLCVPSLRKGREDWDQIFETLSELYVRGADVDWAALDGPGVPRRKVPLPAYPFARTRHWMEAAPATAVVQLAGRPMLSRAVRSPLIRDPAYEVRISLRAHPFIGDHRIHGPVLFPATCFAEAAREAVADAFGWVDVAVEDVAITDALVVPGTGERLGQVVLTPDGDTCRFEVFALPSDPAGDGAWQSFASGMVRQQVTARSAGSVPLDAVRGRSRSNEDGASFYAELAARGFEYGPAFQGIAHAWRGADEMLAELALPDSLAGSAAAYAAHPAFLDAGLQIVLALVPEGESYLPTRIGSLTVGPLPHRLFAHAVRRDSAGTAGAIVCDVRLVDEAGSPLGEVLGIELRAVGRGRGANRLPVVDSWLYEAAWRPAGLPTGSAVHDLPAPTALSSHVNSHLDAVLEAQGMAEYVTVQSPLDRLCAAYGWRALQSLGWRPAAGTMFTSDRLCDELGILPLHRRMAHRVFEMLAEDGVLSRAPGGWTFQRSPVDDGRESAAGSLGANHPRLAKMFEMVDRCGQALAAVLTGRQDPLELLFPQGSLRDIEALYRRSPFTEAYNALVRDGITELVRTLPADRVLRVLEIGAGTGSTSASVLPALPAGRTRYLFTDVSPLFLAQAQDTFAEYPFIEYRTLDADRDPLAHGIEAGSFDLVIASNVLHATSDLRRTLKHVRSLLAPGGMLLLVEGIARQRWVDLIFGLTEGWWKYSDTDLRRDYPLLSQAEWRSLLETSGFDDVAAVPGEARSAALFHQAIILARRTAQAAIGATPDGAARPRRWLALGQRTAVTDGALRHLRESGSSVEVLDASLAQPDELASAIAAAAIAGPIDAVLYAAPCSATADTSPSATAELLHLVQALAADPATSAARLWVVTTGAQAVAPGDDAAGAFISPLWGLSQVITLEHPELRSTCVDVDAEAVDADRMLAQELLGDSPELKVAHRGGARFVSRLARAVPRGDRDGSKSRRLVAVDPGVLDALAYIDSPRRAPAPGEVEIRVRATGLNFKDLLSALGTYPGDAGPLGNECSGEIAAIGAGVSEFAVGDEVVAFAPGSFADFVLADARLVAHKPKDLSHAAAATIAGGFLTAHHALHHLAKIGPSDTVLVHAATGGVGLAAVQLAQRAGAEVIATAGSEAKRDALAAMGVQHRFSSRSTDFAGSVRQATGGRGANVVLNSLAGEMIDATASALSDGGRFVELGKVNRPSGAANQSMEYFNPDVAEECRRDPARFGAVLRDILGAVSRGELAPLPVHAFAERDTIAAFRFMARARHIGKIVVQRDRNSGKAGELAETPIVPDASYLIVGGAGGLGLLVAKHLVERGARHLALMSRRAPGPVEQEAIDQLALEGATVLVLQGDVSRPEDVTDAVARIARELPPLRGVIQSAGVLDDGVLQQQSLARFAGVMGPKVAGTWNLHRATLGIPLDMFVMFSSVASFLGSPGQGNHAAANAFLDAFASYRRARGLPALTINWGAWSDIGAAARRQIGGRIAMRGLGEIAPADGIVAFDRVLDWSDPQVAVVPIDWQVYGRQFSAGQASPFLMDVLQEAEKRAPVVRAAQAPAASFVTSVRAAARGEQPQMVTGMIREHVGRALGLAAAQAINPHQPLGALGLDSLLAVELRNALSRALGLARPLPATLLFDYPTISGLTDYIMTTVIGDPPAAPVVRPPADLSAYEDVAALSDAEAEALLLQELE